MTALEEIDLTATAISDGDLRYLRDLPKLRLLNLSHTGVTDAAVESLAEIQSQCLQDVHCANTHMTDSGMKGVLQLIHERAGPSPVE